MPKSARFVVKKTDEELLAFFRNVAAILGVSHANILLSAQDRQFNYHFDKGDEAEFAWLRRSKHRAIASISVGAGNITVSVERRPDQLKDMSVDLALFDPLLINAERAQPNDASIGDSQIKDLNELIDTAFEDDINLRGAAFKDPKAFQAVIRSHQSMIERLQKMALEVGEQATQARRQLDVEYTVLKARLEEQTAEQRLEGQKALDAERLLLSQRSDEIDLRSKALDDRDNTHVRRELHEKLKARLADRFKKLDLTPQTRNARWPIHIGVAVAGIILALLVYFFTTEALSVTSRADATAVERILVIAKSATASLGFLGIISWYLRWMNRWFERLADSEFQLKQFELDITRAQWVVETAFEWKMSQQSPIPDQLLENISRNLFVSADKDDAADMHPADYLASALIGKASNVKLAVPGGEIELGPKALKGAATA